MGIESKAKCINGRLILLFVLYYVQPGSPCHPRIGLSWKSDQTRAEIRCGFDLAHTLNTNIRSINSMPPTHADCNHYSMSDLRRGWRGGCLYFFFNSKAYKIPRPLFLTIYLMTPHGVLLTNPLFFPYSPSVFPYVSWDEKQNTFVCSKRKRGEKILGGGRGIRLVVWLTSKTWFVDHIPPRSFWIQPGRRRKRQEARALELTPSYPHCWLNRGSPLKCLWPFGTRGAGVW